MLLTIRSFFKNKSFTCFKIVILLGLLATHSSLSGAEKTVPSPPTNTHKPGVRVPQGFSVTLYADDNLAHNIYSMTVDSLGRVVVSGPGYVRILIDSDGDGKADTFRQFADGPKTGAQGMYFHGRDLLCSGDAGLIRYRDRNGDDRADGPPDIFLRAKTGGEHHTHAIRKGPDGWWYLVAGNFAGITEKYATLQTSPIKKPQSGTLLRLKADLTGGEIYADGFRNSYDFAFNSQGDLFLYDSDGERDVSLPWYRPTRVFHVLPASHAGWISRSWKRPDDDFDMPPVVGSFGRGSPTGVACYRHRQFPRKYHNALFILDWTFGRVIALPLKSSGGTWSSQPIEFMTGVGNFGFAPTDIAVGPDGSLFVSVGGRGTRGGVYRITATSTNTKTSNTKTSTPKPETSTLLACLNAPQPLASWSRAKWVPAARKLGADPFLKAALNESLASQQRVRAIEILTELFGGIPNGSLKKFVNCRSAIVRARAIWSHGRTSTAHPDVLAVRPFLRDENVFVRRMAVEALMGASPQTRWENILPSLPALLGDRDLTVRRSTARLVRRLPIPSQSRLEILVRKTSLPAILAFYLGRHSRRDHINPKLASLALQILERKYSTASKREAVRLLQLALGDVGPRQKRPPVFDSYASRLDLKPYERELDDLRIRIAKIFPQKDAKLDIELSRVIAMLSPYNSDLFSKVIAKINDESHPVHDIHYLIVASRIPVNRTTAQQQKIAKTLVALDEKIRKRNLNVDTNWEDRIGEMYQQHAKVDEGLALAIVRQPGFGRAAHVLYLKHLADKHWQTAIDAFAREVSRDEDYRWSNDVIFLLGESKNPAHREIIRNQYANFAVRNATLVSLAQMPEQRDRTKFLRGLEASQLEVLTACISALEKLPPSLEAREQFELLKAIRRLGREKQEMAPRVRLVKLLRRNQGRKFGFDVSKLDDPSHQKAIAEWTRWLAKKYPDDAPRYLSGNRSETAEFKKLLATVNWAAGDVRRGRELFHKRSCVQCHGGRRALGPDLAGVAKRFSRDDVFTAIIQPNRDVSPRYQTTLIQTKAGKTYTGLIIYQSVDGVTLRNGTNQTFRFEADDIEERRTLNSSLMPTGLLKGLKPEDLADLYAYIQSLARS
ncbi:MAG: HEAT repeat domain-containing protein [Planctomycetaceae bacterium]